MKQASRMWFHKLNKALETLGFKQTKSDYALFTKQEGKSIIFVLAYVDELLIAGNDLTKINKLKLELSNFLT